MNQTVAHQAASSELMRWIEVQLDRGHACDQILAALTSTGWQAEVAAGALATVLRGDQAPADPEAPCRSMPLIFCGSPLLQCGDREVHVLASMKSPNIALLGGLLSSAECDELVEMAWCQMERSRVMSDASRDEREVSDVRTSDGMFFDRGQNALCERIEARIAALTRWPVENAEGLQILRYRPGAQYKPHYDYFLPELASSAKSLTRGGQRLATLVMYLNTPLRGGATSFPDANFGVSPVKGNAVFFSYDKPEASTRTLHGGDPVIEGEKWVATKWLRAGRFE